MVDVPGRWEVSAAGAVVVVAAGEASDGLERLRYKVWEAPGSVVAVAGWKNWIAMKQHQQEGPNDWGGGSNSAGGATIGHGEGSRRR